MRTGELKMKQFDQLCKEFETLDPREYGVLLVEKSKKIIPALAAISQDGLTGVTVYATFILGAIVADGKISEEEYLLCYPMFRAFFGNAIDYDEVKRAMKKMRTESKQLKKDLDDMADLLGELSDELKNDIVTVCMMICAIDGKISPKEKNWIKQLIA